jgi:hypothetical protein
MQCRNEHDMIAFLQLILVLTLQLPVCFVDKNQNARSAMLIPLASRVVSAIGDLHCVVQNEQLPSRILHDLVTQIPYQESNVCGSIRLILRRYGKRVLLLVTEEYLKPSAITG